MPRAPKRVTIIEDQVAPVEEVKEEVVVKEEPKKKEPKTGEVTTLLNVRRKPAGEILKQIQPGEKVNILAKEGDWYKIDDGYVMAKFIK